MRRLLRLLFDLFIRSVYSRSDLLLENLALRQQLAVLERRCSRPRFSTPDRLFWVILRRQWPEWRRGLILVQPVTSASRSRGLRGFRSEARVPSTEYVLQFVVQD